MTAREPVLAAIADVYGVPVADLRDDTRLEVLGDSLQLVELGVAIEDALGIDVPTDGEFTWATVGDVVLAAERLAYLETARNIVNFGHLPPEAS